MNSRAVHPVIASTLLITVAFLSILTFDTCSIRLTLVSFVVCQKLIHFR